MPPLTLLEEIKQLTTSEERSRAVITKLKSRYRALLNQFEEHEDEYAEYAGSLKTVHKCCLIFYFR